MKSVCSCLCHLLDSSLASTNHPKQRLNILFQPCFSSHPATTEERVHHTSRFLSCARRSPSLTLANNYFQKERRMFQHRAFTVALRLFPRNHSQTTASRKIRRPVSAFCSPHPCGSVIVCISVHSAPRKT